MLFLQKNPDHPADGYWDQTLIKWVCDQTDSEGVVIIPGAYQADYIDQINAELPKNSLVIITSDEEGKFPVDKLNAGKIWLQYPSNQLVDRYIPIGYTPNPPQPIHKSVDWFYAGQVNSSSRIHLVDVLSNMDGGYLLQSGGFSQGLPREEYNAIMSASKLVPCPGGWINQDSFRLYEALEAGCVPIVDDAIFFEQLLGDYPFLTVKDWDELPQIVDIWKDNLTLRSEVYHWWQDYKEQLVKNMEDDLWALK